MITSQNASRRGLNEWEEAFAGIYGRVDASRRPTDIWLMLLEDASEVAESVRRSKYNEALEALAHVYCWANSFISRCRAENDLGIRIRNDLGVILWNKYPGLCSTCAQSRCICSVLRAEIEEMTPLQRARRKKENIVALNVGKSNRRHIPKTIDDVQDMFNRIYNGAHYGLPIEAIAFHFLEEVGEVAKCIRDLRETSAGVRPLKKKSREQIMSDLQQELEDEIADVLSWSFSLVEKLDFLLGAGAAFANGTDHGDGPQSVQLRMSQALWGVYGNPTGRGIRCPVCGQKQCQGRAAPL